MFISQRSHWHPLSMRRLPLMDSEASDSTWKCLWPLVPAHISWRLHRSPWHQGLLHDLWLCRSGIPPQPQGECCRGCVQLRDGAPAAPVDCLPRLLHLSKMAMYWTLLILGWMESTQQRHSILVWSLLCHALATRSSGHPWSKLCQGWRRLLRFPWEMMRSTTALASSSPLHS